MEEEAIAATTYWCHVCTRTVDPLMESEIKCPFCASGFVEEMAQEEEEEEQDSPNANNHRPNNTCPNFMQLINHLVSNQSCVEDNQTEEAETENEVGGNDVDSQLQEILRRRRGRSSVSTREPESNGDGGGGRERGRVIMVSAGSLSDGFIGPAFEALLQRLAEDDPNRYGTPPARKEAVEALANVKIEEGGLQCSVCLENFEIGVEAKEMPCKHRFHGDCLLPWLELHCSCPICRYELPSDETGMDSARTEPNGNDGGNESSSSTSSQGSEEESDDDGIEIAIPWLISSLFSSSQGSSNP